MENLLIGIVTASILIVLVKTGHFRKFFGYHGNGVKVSDVAQA